MAPESSASSSSDHPDKLSGELFRMCYTMYLYQDQQMWGRTKVLLTVQLAAVAGVYSTTIAHRPVLALLVAFTALLLVLAIGLLIRRDWEIREYYERRLTYLLSRSEHEMTIGELRPKPNYVAGSAIIRCIVATLLVVNLAMTVGFLWDAVSKESQTTNQPKVSGN